MSQNTHEGSGASTAAFVNALSLALGDEQFQTWFGRCNCILRGPDVLEIELPNHDCVRRVQEMFSPEIEQAVCLALGPKVSLVWGIAPPTIPKTQFASAKVHSGFTTIPHRWIDELMPRLGSGPWCVFETLIRFIWRDETDLEILQKHLNRSELVAYISIKKLAQCLGLSQKSVSSHLRKIERFGLLRVTRQPYGRANVYVLGRVEEGCERWFVDLALDGGFIGSK